MIQRPFALPLLIVAALAAPACQLRRPAPGPTADIDPAPVERSMWTGDWDAALAAAEARGWRARGSIEGERLRQSLLLRLGRRAELLAEVREWRRADPLEPSLAYLEARLLQQPDRQYARFRDLLKLHPRHAWIRLGAAGLAQAHGRWGEARRQLALAPEWEDAAEFRAILLARQAAHDGRPADGLAALEELALEHDRRAALTEAQLIAAEAPEAVQTRIAAHRALLALSQRTPPRERMRAVAERAIAEHRYDSTLTLEALLPLLDAWSERVDLPGGWEAHPRYTIPLVGQLVRPERDSGGPAAAWHAAGCKLVMGQSVLRGTELLYLEDVDVRELDWPGFAKPVEIVLAQSGVSSSQRRVVGGAVFRGFYVQRDMAVEVAQVLRREAEDYAGPVDAPDGFASQEDGWLPEDLDLPLRIRAARLDRDFARAELTAVLVHEAGHLPEVRRSLPDGPSLGQMIGLFYFTLWAGDPMAGFEMRAQARALAAAPDPHWVLADVVERAREIDGTYAIAYRWLLEDLVALAEAARHPALAYWNRMPADDLRALAGEVCRRRNFGLLDAAAVDRLLVAAEDWLAGR